jgi:hypothetical protein
MVLFKNLLTSPLLYHLCFIIEIYSSLANVNDVPATFASSRHAPRRLGHFFEKMSRKKISQNELFYSLETIKTKKSDIFTKTKTFGRELTALDAI